MKILHIDCSVRNENSLSRLLSKRFVDQLISRKIFGVTVARLDLAEDTPQHPSELFTQAIYTPRDKQTESMKLELKNSDELINKLMTSDLYVIGMPMYNFSVPSNFKTFIDNVVRIDKTFIKGPDGFQGRLINKKAVIINTRGADFKSQKFSEMDNLVPYIKIIFAFMGIKDIHFINVFPVQFSDTEARNEAIAKAHKEIEELVQHF